MPASIQTQFFDRDAVSVARDLKVAGVIEVATARDGDPSPTGTGVLRIKRGIEVGHIFKLGTKYSEAMKCEVADPQQKMVPLQMGCYGLGVGRTVAAAVRGATSSAASPSSVVG